MFNSELTRRIDKVEQEIQHCNEVKATSIATEAALAHQLKEIGGILNGHATREEVLLKEQVNSSGKTTTILLGIKNDIHGIKNDIELQAKDNSIQLLEQQETLKAYCNNEFATSKDMESGFKSLRAQARLVWVILLACLVGFSWLITTAISLFPSTPT